MIYCHGYHRCYIPNHPAGRAFLGHRTGRADYDVVEYVRVHCFLSRCRGRVRSLLSRLKGVELCKGQKRDEMIDSIVKAFGIYYVSFEQLSTVLSLRTSLLFASASIRSPRS